MPGINPPAAGSGSVVLEVGGGTRRVGLRQQLFTKQAGNTLIFNSLSWYFMDDTSSVHPHSSEGVIGHFG